jgi:N-acetylmuramic acid 6-phosphate etherase
MRINQAGYLLMSFREKTNSFLQIASQFKLGHLVTESFHEKTHHLSQLVKKDVRSAHRLLQQVDHEALQQMEGKKNLLWKLAQDIQDTLNQGHKVFMCGCGATGRLSLVLETLYRQLKGETDQVVSFMAGGDFALIKSVESFEDQTSFGARQLMELGFGPHDLLLASTEGGETAFVIGATHQAAEYSDRKPYFLYCNPDELLMPIDRSRLIIEDNRINKVNLSVGPMAISGSTRMQASTVLMLAIGVGLLHEHKNEEAFNKFYEQYLIDLQQTDYSRLADLTQLEAQLYSEKKYLNYLTDEHLGISILTDTTERSPTFSLRAFENSTEDQVEPSLSYLFLPGQQSSQAAWRALLWRSPRALNWQEFEDRIGERKVYGFDISESGRQIRSQKVDTEDFRIFYQSGKVHFSCQQIQVEFNWGSDPLKNHLMTKMLLNAHSTLIMGLLGRYEGNVMTWVRPSNYKLIDRAARYILQLAARQGKSVTYDAVVELIFKESETLKENDPIVLRVLERI